MNFSELNRESTPEFEDVFSIGEKTLGFFPNSMLFMAIRPDLLFAFSILTKSVMRPKVKVGLFTKLKILLRLIFYLMRGEKQGSLLSEELKWTVAYATSNAAQCNYCMAHTKHMIDTVGMDQGKFDEIFTFNDSDKFSEAEKVAIDVAILGGSVPNGVTKEKLKGLGDLYSKEEVIEIISIISLFGFLNRWNNSLNTPIEDIS